MQKSILRSSDHITLRYDNYQISDVFIECGLCPFALTSSRVKEISFSFSRLHPIQSFFLCLYVHLPLICSHLSYLTACLFFFSLSVSRSFPLKNLVCLSVCCSKGMDPFIFPEHFLFSSVGTKNTGTDFYFFLLAF